DSRGGQLSLFRHVGERESSWVVWSAFLPAVAWGQLLFACVFCGGLLDHFAHHRAIAGHVRADLLEAGAIPLLELHHARAFVVFTAGFDRREEARRTQLLDPGI